MQNYEKSSIYRNFWHVFCYFLENQIIINMKKLLPFLLLLLLITFSSWSPMWAATHTISGKVLNQTTGEAVDMATVRLFSYHNADSTLVQGLQTDQ